MNTNEKRLITILITTFILVGVIKIPTYPSNVFSLVISMIVFIGLVFLLPQLCLWSGLHEKEKGVN